MNDETRYTYYSDIYGNEHEFVNGFKYSHTDDDYNDVYVDPDGYDYYFDDELGYFYYGEDDDGYEAVFDMGGYMYYYDEDFGYFYYGVDDDGNDILVSPNGNLLGYFDEDIDEDNDGNNMATNCENIKFDMECKSTYGCAVVFGTEHADRNEGIICRSIEYLNDQCGPGSSWYDGEKKCISK